MEGAVEWIFQHQNDADLNDPTIELAQKPEVLATSRDNLENDQFIPGTFAEDAPTRLWCDEKGKNKGGSEQVQHHW